MKTLSIVIPNYNNAKYLPKCLDSVLAQTYPLKEIVIYDDCSNDDSRNILKEYAAKDPRIKLILPDENRGVSVARDTAIRACTSEYATTLDSDDFLYDCDKLSREMAKINASDVPACAFSQTVAVDEDGNVCGDMTMHDLQKDIRFRTVTHTMGAFVARDLCFPVEVYKEVGGYVRDMKLYEDWDLSLKFLSRCPFLFSGGYGTAYRQKAGGLSRVSQRKIVAAKIRAFRQGGKFLDYTIRERFVFYTRTFISAFIDTLVAIKKKAAA